MSFPRRGILHLTAGAALLSAIGFTASAQTYPARPVTMFVPYPAGGGIDALARVLSEHLSRSLGQPIVIEDIGGAGGTIAMGRLARAVADGYVLGIGTVDQVVNGAIYQLQYDVVSSFEPIALLASSPYLVVSKTAVPASNLTELIAWLRSNAGRIAQGHNGELEPVREWASKAAEHACRIAGVLTLANDPTAIAVGAETMRGALELMRHYLEEYMRLVGSAGVSEDIRYAEVLRGWLRSKGLRSLTPRHVMRFGPNSIRSADIARTALRTLREHGWVSTEDDRTYSVHPATFSEGST